MQAEKPSQPGSPSASPVPATFETHPSRYRHWKLSVNGPIARLEMAVREDEPLVPGYQLKLNSYDLGVDIELADAVQRIRFAHPEVSVVVVTSARERVFCSGANIHMLGQSTHGFKVNFCKYTNETRLGIEDATDDKSRTFLAALNGPCAGGGYELAMACSEIILIDDGSSAVSLPEVPLLGVLPGTGGLTRLIDKRKVRRDRADVFSTLAEGIRGKRAVEWGLVDQVVPRSRFAEKVDERARALAQQMTPGTAADAVELEPLTPATAAEGVRYRFIELKVDRPHRVATLIIQAPAAAAPTTIEGVREQAKSGNLWALRAFRELDDALLRLRFHEPTVGLVLLRTRGNAELVTQSDEALAKLADHYLVREVLRHQARVLRRLDQTSRSFFAIVDPESCFAGSLLETLLAADRSYVLEDKGVSLRTSVMNRGSLPMNDGASRLTARFCGRPGLADAVLAAEGPIDATTADKLGLCTVLADEIDFEDTLRLAIEERLSLSPDALTGLEQNLRFTGREGMEQRIFGRLSAWQNWIFTRSNATGARGALTSYGKPERPVFDWNRT